MSPSKQPPKRSAQKGSRQSRRCEFDSLKLPPNVIEGIRDAGFEEMTPIQRQALPITLAGRDLCGQAQTGTGKTAAFLITMFTRFQGEFNPERRFPLALILAPTRELAMQIYRESMMLGDKVEMRIACIYGGEGYSHQEKKLRTGVDAVIGTPGRLLDFVRRGVLDLSQIRFLVIDEADRLLDMGFWDELREILRRLPRPRDRQSMLFSATLNFRTKQIALSYMNDPVDVAIKPESVAAEGIEQTVFHVERERKLELLLGILAREEIPKGLVFANRKVVAGWIQAKLRQHGYEAELLTGDLNQKVRNRVLERFKNNEVPLLVASDVASRGLHIDDVSHIINYDVPQDPEDYIHRIGRTARAGKTGKAYTLACDEYCYTLPDIQKLLNEPLPYKVPFEEDFAEDRTPDFTIGRMIRMERQKKGDSGRPDKWKRNDGGRRDSRPASRPPQRNEPAKNSRKRRHHGGKRGQGPGGAPGVR